MRTEEGVLRCYMRGNLLENRSAVRSILILPQLRTPTIVFILYSFQPRTRYSVTSSFSSADLNPITIKGYEYRQVKNSEGFNGQIELSG